MNATESGRDHRAIEIPVHLARAPSAEVMVTLLVPMLRRIARRYERDTPSCGDLLQEMLIAIWLSLDSYEKISSFRGWVQGIAHEVGMEHIAKRRINQRAERLSDDPECIPNPYDTESIVELRERALTLMSLLSELRPREREAILLDLQEFEMREISAAMKISQAQVRDALVRAKRRLMLWMRKREALDAEPGSEVATALDDAPVFARASTARTGRKGSERRRLYFIEPLRK